MPQSVAFHVSRQPNKADTIAAVGFWMALGLGCVEAVILLPVVPAVLGPKGVHLITISRIYLIYLPIAFIGLTLLGRDQGTQKFARYNALKILPPLFYVSGLSVLAIIKRATVGNVLLISLLGQFAASAIRVGVPGSRLFPHDWKYALGLSKKIAKQGLIFSLPALSGIILMSADIALLIHMVSAEQVGYYSVALAIALGQTGIASSLIQVNFPKVASASSQEGKFILWRQFKKSIVPIIGMGAIVAICTPFFVKYLFGMKFLPSLPVAYFLIVAIMIWGMGQVLENGLRGMGSAGPGTIANIVGLCVLIPSAFLLVPTRQATGMAAALLVAQSVVFLILLVSVRRIISSRKFDALLASK